ncbi:hypothetical protein QFZ57_003559 [Arthrobacter sp. B1I2]|nr:hypothetical protein [Arthrobacter sp. B1I2]
MTTRPLFHVPDGAARDVGLGNLPHGDGTLDAGFHACLLQEILQCQAVHDRSQHPHIVGAGAVHAALGQFRAAEEVSAAHHNGHFHLRDRRRDLLGNVADGLGVDTQLPTAEDLAGKLQEDPPLALLGMDVSVDGFHDAFPLLTLKKGYPAGSGGRNRPCFTSIVRMQKGRPPKWPPPCSTG